MNEERKEVNGMRRKGRGRKERRHWRGRREEMSIRYNII
jgi:hypothetical protein